MSETREMTLLNPKGGTGKTTLAAALAVRAAQQGHKVMLLDTDPQASLYQWAQRRRREPLLSAEAVPLQGLGRRLGSLRRSREFSLIVIDTHGSLSGIEPAVAYASLVVVPIQPSGADLLELNRALEFCHRHGRLTYVVGNRVKTPRERAEIPAALAAIAGARAVIAHTLITDRVSHRAQFLEGLVAEETGDQQAKAELFALAKELKL